MEPILQEHEAGGDASFSEAFDGEAPCGTVGHLGPEENLDSPESLISAIQGDIEEAKRRLDLPEHLKPKEDSFFPIPESKIILWPGMKNHRPDWLVCCSLVLLLVTF